MKKASFLDVLESPKDYSAGLYGSKEGSKQTYKIAIESGLLLLYVSVRMEQLFPQSSFLPPTTPPFNQLG
jgi:hypothetical protein